MNSFTVGQIIVINEPILRSGHGKEAILLSLQANNEIWLVQCDKYQYFLRENQMKPIEKVVPKLSINPPDLGIIIYE